MESAVTQMHGMGCGVAAVAFIAGISYESALSCFSQPENAWTVGYNCEDLVHALSKCGFSYAYKKIRDLEEPVLRQERIIVFVDSSCAYPSGHYLARAEVGWMNSWANFPIIAPAKSAFVRELPGGPLYAIYPKTELVDKI